VSEQFFEELTALLEIVATFRCQVIVTSDFNIHVNNLADRHAVRLAELLSSFDLHQAVAQPTHKDGNILDLIITRSDGQPAAPSIHPTSSLTIP